MCVLCRVGLARFRLALAFLFHACCWQLICLFQIGIFHEPTSTCWDFSLPSVLTIGTDLECMSRAWSLCWNWGPFSWADVSIDSSHAWCLL
jgi:hypothetical protein